MTSDEVALPVVKPMPMIQVTAIREAPLPVRRPLYDGITDWPGKAAGRRLVGVWASAAGLFLTLLVFSVIAKLVSAF